MGDFQTAGEVCSNCQERWEKAKKPPIKMLRLPAVTMKYKQEVAVCPYCDGPIRDISIATAKRREQDEKNG